MFPWLSRAFMLFLMKRKLRHEEQEAHHPFLPAFPIVREEEKGKNDFISKEGMAGIVHLVKAETKSVELNSESLNLEYTFSSFSQGFSKQLHSISGSFQNKKLKGDDGLINYFQNGKRMEIPRLQRRGRRVDDEK